MSTAAAPQPRTRGRLRLYLGVAPGVGKTHAMLDEARRRLSRGTDVVSGVVETRGRRQVEQLAAGVPTVSADLDVDALVARRPDVVLVDDLARHWEAVERLLDEGLDVISTVDIAELESLTDVVTSITGVPPSRSVPDEVVRRADQVELVDMTPEALRRRLAHGNVYPAERVDAALSQYFRVGNLTALRELALLWLADRVDEGLEQYRRDHGIETTWAARERVVVALSGGPESDVLLRRGARIAARGSGGELHAVFVTGPSGPPVPADRLAQLRVLAEELGGSYHAAAADDVAEGVLSLARSLNATQLLVGVSRRPRWRALLSPGVGERIVADAHDLDVLVVPHPYARRGRRTPGRSSALDPRRVVAGWLLAVGGPALAAVLLVPSVHPRTVALEAMSFLALTVLCALVGGMGPALAAALLGGLLLNWFFTPPQRSLTIADSTDVVAIVVFLVVAVAVASVVDRAAKRSVDARRAREEAEVLTMLNRRLLESEPEVTAVLSLVRETFGVRSAALLRRADPGWRLLGAVGEDPPSGSGDAGTVADVGPDLLLALGGPPLAAHERRVLAGFATHLAVVLERQELGARAAAAHRLEEGNRVRSALLAAVSHDLRTPLAGIKAAVSSLRSPEVHWSQEDEAELLGTIEDATDRLHAIVANLLDLSRLQADAVRPSISEIGLDDVVARAVSTLPPELRDGDRLVLQLDPDVAPVLADAGLLERVVANLVDNAVRHSPPGTPVVLSTSQAGGRVQLRVVDRGPGVPDPDKEQMFVAFQRLGDHRATDGLGLGLAVARGLTEALGGTLEAEDTPGGGLTMVVDLPRRP